MAGKLDPMDESISPSAYLLSVGGETREKDDGVSMSPTISPRADGGAISPRADGGEIERRMDSRRKTDLDLVTERTVPQYMSVNGDMHSYSILCVIKDISLLTSNEVENLNIRVRASRLATTFVLLAFTMFLQGYVMWRAKTLLCAKSIHYIRDLYSQYEFHMYTQTVMTVNGEHRGVPGTFVPERFSTFPEAGGEKEKVCQIPLSQPDFLGAVLLIWTITVMFEIRECWKWAYRYIYITPTVENTKDMWKIAHDPSDGAEKGTLIVMGITKRIKILIGFLNLVQGLVAIALCWVGCRFLVATPGFGDLVLNGLALEFILNLKELLYRSLLPRFYHHETENLRVQRASVKMNMETVLVPLLLLLACITWVVLYMKVFQQVLPDYNWDVRETCREFLEAMHMEALINDPAVMNQNKTLAHGHGGSVGGVGGAGTSSGGSSGGGGGHASHR